MCGVAEAAAIIKAEPGGGAGVDTLTLHAEGVSEGDTLTLHAGPSSSTLCLPNGTPFTLPQEISFTLASLTPGGPPLTFTAPPSCSSSSSPLEEGAAVAAGSGHPFAAVEAGRPLSPGMEFQPLGSLQLAALLPVSGGSLLPVSGGSLLPVSGGSLLPVSGGSLLPVSGGSLLPVSGGSLLAATRSPLLSISEVTNTLLDNNQ
jgi:hypothetical protein